MKGWYYILDEHGDPQATDDVVKWGEWFEKTDRKLAVTNIADVMVSTVFLGLNHRFGEGEPLLWETMIFGGKHNDYQARYPTKELALQGHRQACELAGG